MSMANSIIITLVGLSEVNFNIGYLCSVFFEWTELFWQHSVCLTAYWGWGCTDHFSLISFARVR